MKKIFILIIIIIVILIRCKTENFSKSSRENLKKNSEIENVASSNLGRIWLNEFNQTDEMKLVMRNQVNFFNNLKEFIPQKDKKLYEEIVKEEIELAKINIEEMVLSGMLDIEVSKNPDLYKDAIKFIYIKGYKIAMGSIPRKLLKKLGIANIDYDDIENLKMNYEITLFREALINNKKYIFKTQKNEINIEKLLKKIIEKEEALEILVLEIKEKGEELNWKMMEYIKLENRNQLYEDAKPIHIYKSDEY